jgi:hypothetical protein
MISRRSLLVSVSGLLFTNACKRAGAMPSSCEDNSGLSEEERTARTTLAYADRAPDPNKACQSCQQWVAAKADGSCGSCKLLKGPIHPLGTCKAFALKG